MRQIIVVVLYLLALTSAASAESYRVVGSGQAAIQIVSVQSGQSRPLLFHPGGMSYDYIVDEFVPPPTKQWPWLILRGHGQDRGAPGPISVVAILNVESYELRTVLVVPQNRAYARFRWVQRGDAYELWADERHGGIGRVTRLSVPRQPFCRAQGSGTHWFNGYVAAHEAVGRALRHLRTLPRSGDLQVVRSACRPTACRETVDYYVRLAQSPRPFVPTAVCLTSTGRGVQALCLVSGSLNESGERRRVIDHLHLHFNTTYGWFEIPSHLNEWLRHAEQGHRDDEPMDEIFLRKQREKRGGRP